MTRMAPFLVYSIKREVRVYDEERIVNESKCVRLHDTVTERIIIFDDGNQGQTIW